MKFVFNPIAVKIDSIPNEYCMVLYSYQCTKKIYYAQASTKEAYVWFYGIGSAGIELQPHSALLG